MRPFVDWETSISNVSLDAAGLVALADLTTLARRTALTGTGCLADIFVLCPGIHRQQQATELHGGEYPITANMTSGYVFRVENQSTVHFLQSISKTAWLTTIRVFKQSESFTKWQPFIDLSGSWLCVLLYLGAVVSTLIAIIFMILLKDFWGLGIIGILMLARLLNFIVLRKRTRPGWHGAAEPGVTGDLLVLLSQDRWVRIKGLVDDIKAVTSGQWLKDESFFESWLEGSATVMVYLAAALASNATQVGKIILVVLLLVNVGLLATSNSQQDSLHMKGFVLSKTLPPKYYKRRLDLADELIKESRRRDWALKIGLINEKLENNASLGSKEVQV